MRYKPKIFMIILFLASTNIKILLDTIKVTENHRKHWKV